MSGKSSSGSRKAALYGSGFFYALKLPGKEKALIPKEREVYAVIEFMRSMSIQIHER